jgi:hypothetical protein
MRTPGSPARAALARLRLDLGVCHVVHQGKRGVVTPWQTLAVSLSASVRLPGSKVPGYARSFELLS